MMKLHNIQELLLILERHHDPSFFQQLLTYAVYLERISHQKEMNSHGNIIDLEPKLIIEKSPELLESAKGLGDFIKSLPLSVEDNNRLVYWIVEQVDLSAKNGFSQGIKLAREIAKWEAEQK